MHFRAGSFGSGVFQATAPGAGCGLRGADTRLLRQHDVCGLGPHGLALHAGADGPVCSPASAWLRDAGLACSLLRRPGSSCWSGLPRLTCGSVSSASRSSTANTPRHTVRPRPVSCWSIGAHRSDPFVKPRCSATAPGRSSRCSTGRPPARLAPGQIRSAIRTIRPFMSPCSGACWDASSSMPCGTSIFCYFAKEV